MKTTLAIMFTAIALSAPAANHAHAASHAAHPKYALYALDKGAAVRDLEAFDDGVACIEALDRVEPIYDGKLTLACERARNKPR
jgi:streptogramin lyase